MYPVRWLLLLTLVMSVSCEYQEIGCYLTTPLDNGPHLEFYGGDPDNLAECTNICEENSSYDTAQYSDDVCYCSSVFNPLDYADAETDECTPLSNVYIVSANLVTDCSPNCAACTSRRCIRCDSTSEFDDQYNCQASGDACTSSPCGDVCTLDASAPDGFICSCSDDSHFLDENNDCQACTTISPNCLQCSSSTQCSQCSGIFVVDANGNCEDGDACTSSPCGDVCTLDSSAPDGFTCSCSDDSQYLDENNDCQASCSMTRRPIQHYPDLYRGSIIFVDFPFQCGGSVSAVEFYAERAGTFYFTAWRPSASGDSWTLLGYNAIVSKGEESQTYPIPSDNQMVVLASDVFGFVYEKGVRYKIISSENISKRHRNGTSSRFVHTRETLDDLSIGVSRSNLAGEGDTERIVPINAIIS